MSCNEVQESNNPMPFSWNVYTSLGSIKLRIRFGGIVSTSYILPEYTLFNPIFENTY